MEPPASVMETEIISIFLAKPKAFFFLWQSSWLSVGIIEPNPSLKLWPQSWMAVSHCKMHCILLTAHLSSFSPLLIHCSMPFYISMILWLSVSLFLWHNHPPHHMSAFHDWTHICEEICWAKWFIGDYHLYLLWRSLFTQTSLTAPKNSSLLEI